MELNNKQLQGLIDIFSELETEKILEKSVKKISEILNAKGCSIFMYDEESNMIQLASTTSQHKKPVFYKEGEGLTGWVFKHQTSLLIQDLDKKTDMDLKKKYGEDIYVASKFIEGKIKSSKSYIAVPLFDKNKLFLGIIRLSSSEENFNKEDLELLENIAKNISIAIQNGYLYLNEHKKADYFKLLAEFGTKLHSYYSRDSVMDFVAEQVAKTFSSETCEIYILDNELEILVLRAGWGIPPELLNTATHEIGEGLTGTIVKEKRSIRLKNVLTFSKYKGKYRKKMKQNLKYGDRLAFLGVPISMKSDVIGCIKLYNKIPRYPGGQSFFSEDDEHYLSIVADMLSVALENLNYLESMQNTALQMIKTQRLTALGTMAIRLPNEITNSLTTAHLTTKNLIRKIEKTQNINSNLLIEKLTTIDQNLWEVTQGVKSLHEFSTKAGFLKMKKTWQEIIDESLLFLSGEIIHKKINIHREKSMEEQLPHVYVEPNEMIEVVINLFILAITPIKHYESDVYILVSYNNDTKEIITKIVSIDSIKKPLVNAANLEKNSPEYITPQEFMYKVAVEIIENNYQGKIKIDNYEHGVQIELSLPLKDEMFNLKKTSHNQNLSHKEKNNV